ncbi:MAG: hypothetical protein DRH24_11000, partial [Deltaproteobacteria bacterium]
GIQQGIQQGVQQGILEEARNLLMELLEERFGPLNSSTVLKIKAVERHEVLKRLFKHALRIESLEKFREMLAKVEE